MTQKGDFDRRRGPDVRRASRGAGAELGGSMRQCILRLSRLRCAAREVNDATIIDMRERIASLALLHRIPAFSSIPEMTDAGGIAGYGTPRADLYRRSAYYVKRIFDGAKPGDLPVEQPTRIELSINMKTAKTLGITIPDTLLARADRVVE